MNLIKSRSIIGSVDPYTYHRLLSRSEEVGGVGHCFELKVVSGGVFEEHGPLLSDLPLEAKMRFYYEFDACFL
jgi:hypothetical protein